MQLCASVENWRNIDAPRFTVKEITQQCFVFLGKLVDCTVCRKRKHFKMLLCFFVFCKSNAGHGGDKSSRKQVTASEYVWDG